MTNIASPKTVLLPDGSVVKVSDTSEAWCSTHDGYGYVELSTIAPDPDQPRKYMGAAELAELFESIATAGIREPITVTPRFAAPWARVAPEHEGCFFLAVSGHRRHAGGNESKLPAAPIRVKTYRTEAEHREDASLLNGNRANLTALEEGLEMVRMRGLGQSLESIRKHHGYSMPTVYSRINLTKLHPEIQTLIDPEVPPKLRLSTNVAGALGGVTAPSYAEWTEAYDALTVQIPDKKKLVEPFEEASDDDRRFALQFLLLAVIVQKRLKQNRAIELIRDQSIKLGTNGTHHKKTERLQPARRREVVANFAAIINDSVLMDWSPAEFRRVFELASREEVESIIALLQGSAQSIGGFIKILSTIRDSKKPTHPEALRLVRARKDSAAKRASK